MNYEKKYKEALERAKKAKNNVSFNAQTHKVLDIIFSELKENEDEKIRKAVIEMIHDTPNIECEENYNVRKEDVIAWLEKQKKPEDMVHITELKVWPANSATTANRQLYNRAILKILSNYVEKYPDIRFGQMLCNLDVNPHFGQESRETYCNLNEIINKQK